MSDTYTLDRELVKAVLRETDGKFPAQSNMDVLLNALTEQLPVQLPTGLGAVMRLEDGRVAVRADQSVNCWCVHSGDTYNTWHSDSDLPRVAEVLSAGVEVEV